MERATRALRATWTHPNPAPSGACYEEDANIMLGEHHSIHREFPQHRDRIDTLSRERFSFREKVEEHDRLDKEIRGLELRENPISDDDMDALKLKRIRLKDEIYRLLNGGT